MSLKNLILIISTLNIFLACSDPSSFKSNILVEKLLSSPDTLILSGHKIVIRASLCRDFQPTVPLFSPDGNPMNGIIFIETTDSSQFPERVTTKNFFIVNQDEVWESDFSDEKISDDLELPFRLVKFVRDGPKWDTGIYVCVVVPLKFNNDLYYLKASNQYIFRTE